MKQIQLVWSHPRTDSLTAKVVEAVKEEFKIHEYLINELDLNRMSFNPVLDTEDEPDWSNIDKKYSDEVMHLAEELQGKSAAFFVFPLWWCYMPAKMKGYIDRVWNHGITYGTGRKLPFNSIRWIALAGEPEHSFVKRGLDTSIANLLNVGIGTFCGAKDTQVEMLYDTLCEDGQDLEAHHAKLILQARKVVRDWVQQAKENTI